jgi:phage N-6-adenine-methyltransferase
VVDRVHFSSATSEHATPQVLWDRLNKKFRFTIDVAATAENAKCARFYTKEDSGLLASWAGETVWMNPPYGEPEYPCHKTNCKKKRCRERGFCVYEYVPGVIDWVRKAHEERHEAIIVALLPSRTDAVWFQQYVLPYVTKDSFLPGRLKFGDSKNSAPFPSCVVVF